MKVINKLTIIGMILFFCITFGFSNQVLAVSLQNMEKDADSFIDAGKKAAEDAGHMNDVITSVTDNFTGLGQILTVVGAGVLVAVISFMGIKYLISPPDKQAELKNRLIYVAVAGVVIFGAYGIWSAILDVVSKF